MNYVVIQNQKSGKQYRIFHFKSYSIDQNLSIPTDAFHFTIGNNFSEVSNVVSAGDEIWFYINDKLVLNGIIDDFDVDYSNTSNEVTINGRDKACMLLDNDSLPSIYYNITLKEYLSKQINEYGFENFKVDDDHVFPKVHIHPGESEWHFIERLCQERGLWPRYDIDTFVCSKLRSDTEADYHFSNDYSGTIKFKNAKIRISSDIKNEVMIYGGHYNVNKGTYKNRLGIKSIASDDTLKIKKRKVINYDDVENNTAADAMAKAELQKLNRKAFSIELTMQTKQAFYINKIAKITDKTLGLDGYLIVDNVQYSHSISEGSITKVILRLIQGIPFTWLNHNIPSIPK